MAEIETLYRGLDAASLPFELAVEVAARGGDAVVADCWATTDEALWMVMLFGRTGRRDALVRAAWMCTSEMESQWRPPYTQVRTEALWTAMRRWTQGEILTGGLAAVYEQLDKGVESPWDRLVIELVELVLDRVFPAMFFRAWLIAARYHDRCVARDPSSASARLAALLRAHLPTPTWSSLTDPATSPHR